MNNERIGRNGCATGSDNTDGFAGQGLISSARRPAVLAHRKTRDHDPSCSLARARAREESARSALERHAAPLRSASLCVVRPSAVDPSIHRDGITSCQSRAGRNSLSRRALAWPTDRPIGKNERTADGRARGALMPGSYRSTLFEPQLVLRYQSHDRTK